MVADDAVTDIVGVMSEGSLNGRVYVLGVA